MHTLCNTRLRTPSRTLYLKTRFNLQGAGHAPQRDPLQVQLPRSKWEKTKRVRNMAPHPNANPLRVCRLLRQLLALAPAAPPQQRRCQGCNQQRRRAQGNQQAVPPLEPAPARLTCCTGTSFETAGLIPPHPPLLAGAEYCRCSVRPVPKPVPMSDHSSP